MPPPSTAPGNLTLVSAKLFGTTASWTGGGAGWNTGLSYSVVDSARNPVPYGYDRNITVPYQGGLSDKQYWDMEIYNYDWRIKVIAQFFNEAGGGPGAGRTPAVTLHS